MEHEPNKEEIDTGEQIEGSTSVLRQPNFQRFIERRNIKPEDLYLIEELVAFPKNLIILELHNLFNMYHERSREELERMIRENSNEQKTALCTIMLEVYKRYDWQTCYNLVRVLESET